MEHISGPQLESIFRKSDARVDALHVLLAYLLLYVLVLSYRPVRLCCQVIHPCGLYLTDRRLKANLQFSDGIANFTGRLATSMVAPLFGWSAGDIVVSIQIIYRIGKAFGEVGGAKEQYAETATWLDNFAGDLERIVEHVTDNPTAKYTENIKQQIANIDRHYAHFEKYVRKQDAALSSTSSINAVKQAFVKVRWAVKELKGHVDSLKTAVSGPLISI